MTCVRRISPALKRGLHRGVVEAVRAKADGPLGADEVLRLHRAQLRHNGAACAGPVQTGCEPGREYAACRGAHRQARRRGGSLEAEPRPEPGAHRCARREQRAVRERELAANRRERARDEPALGREGCRAEERRRRVTAVEQVVDLANESEPRRDSIARAQIDDGVRVRPARPRRSRCRPPRDRRSRSRGAMVPENATRSASIPRARVTWISAYSLSIVALG
jgi:hypothetical protein